MNSLWPAASRFPCLNHRTIFSTCVKIDSLAARIAQRSLRPYSITPLPSRRRDAEISRGSTLKTVWRVSDSGNLMVAVRTFATQRIVITEYGQLPKDYRDSKGLPYRTHPLSLTEMKSIFGKGIDVNAADRTLRVLHGRRVAGTLEDPGLPNVHDPRVQNAAMAWLRRNVPVDEVECAGLHAEAVLGLTPDAEKVTFQPNAGVDEKDIYGKSTFDAIRKQKEKAFDELEARKKTQAEEVREVTGTLEKVGPQSQVELRRRGENPRLKYYLERAKVLPDTPPEMSSIQRLWASGLVTLFALIGCYILTQVYTPPAPSKRLWPDIPPAAATIIGIILANSAVLIAWHSPPALRLLNKYFIVVPGYPRAMSIIGNIFSHQTLPHFATNMAILWFVGTRLHDEVGRANFLAIYIASGVLGSYVSLVSWVLRKSFISSHLGASGAVCGTLGAYFTLNSSEKVRILGFPPENWPSISAMTFLLILMAVDVIGLRGPVKVGLVDHWAHLGGYTSGIASVLLMRMQARRKREAMAMRRNSGIN